MSASKHTNGNHRPAINNEEAVLPAVLRQHAEQQYAEELAELARVDEGQRPPNWKLSPSSRMPPSDGESGGKPQHQQFPFVGRKSHEEHAQS